MHAGHDRLAAHAQVLHHDMASRAGKKADDMGATAAHITHHLGGHLRTVVGHARAAASQAAKDHPAVGGLAAHLQAKADLAGEKHRATTRGEYTVSGDVENRPQRVEHVMTNPDEAKVAREKEAANRWSNIRANAPRLSDDEANRIHHEAMRDYDRKKAKEQKTGDRVERVANRLADRFDGTKHP
jgi:hypothetical protein